jgi:hypothetical protein
MGWAGHILGCAWAGLAMLWAVHGLASTWDGLTLRSPDNCVVLQWPGQWACSGLAVVQAGLALVRTGHRADCP